jgi:hypothetical protein
MVPIEQVQVGTLIFLECGCSAIRWIAHPTGAAALVLMQEACERHRAEKIEVRAVRKGTLVSPLMRPTSMSA